MHGEVIGHSVFRPITCAQLSMVFTLGTLFEAALLLVNAVAILNEERFLKKGRECVNVQLTRTYRIIRRVAL